MDPADRLERSAQPRALGEAARGLGAPPRRGPPSGDAAPSPEAAALDRERDEALLAALAQLSEADRQILTCRYLLDLSEAETADTLGLRRGTVKSRLSRALGRLRDVLPETLGPPSVAEVNDG